MLIEAMAEINNRSEFIDHYKKGQRLFVGLEFEHGESFNGLQIQC